MRTPDGTGSGWAGASHYDWSRIDPAALGARAAEKARASRNPVAVEPGLAEVLKGAKIFAIDADYAGANRKRIVDRWIAEVLNP